MNVAATRSEMLARAASLKQRLAAARTESQRTVLVAAARREIEQLRKQFKRRIDQRAQGRFAVNEREGIERKLEDATASALALVEQTVRGNDSIEAKLVARLCWASNDGCPVAGSSQDKWAEMASVARRRWFSFERRRPKKIEDNRPNRVEDLARGLCERFERGGLKMAGPLISDYRWLAEHLAEVFFAESQ
jgi:hypothetical protein